jgi:hypothetical protein
VACALAGECCHLDELRAADLIKMAKKS